MTRIRRAIRRFAAIDNMGKKLEAATNGRIKIRCSPVRCWARKEAVEQVQLGAIQMARFARRDRPDRAPVNVFNMPFVFRDEAHMRKGHRRTGRR